MIEGDPVILRAALFEVIENQMRDGTPPETKTTYDRLIAEGYSHEDTMKMLAGVLATEMYDMLKRQRMYDGGRYISKLNALPDEEWKAAKKRTKGGK
jgi:hypothetical protein